MKFSTSLKLLLITSGLSFGTIASAQLANNYPGDSLIQNDPNVIFTEMFEQVSIDTLLKGYSNISNKSNISFDSTVPFGSKGKQSGKFTSYQSPSTQNGTEIRRKMPNGISDSVFVRFYVKYNDTHTHHHSGIWLHGSNPANNCFPCIYPGRKGKSPGGDSAFSLGAELRGATMAKQSKAKFGMFNYWTAMHANSAGEYYGNEFVNPNADPKIITTEWNCIEVMLKLNNPVSGSSGEAKLWINGKLIEHYGAGFPSGSWNELTFTQGAGQAFDGFQWRSSAAVLFNSIWIKNYTFNGTDTQPNNIWYDHIVVAKKYIGPIYTPTNGVAENTGVDPVLLFPNPAGSEVKLNRVCAEIQLRNLQGQLLSEFLNTDQFSVSEIPNGIYFIQVGEQTQKLVVSH